MSLPSFDLSTPFTAFHLDRMGLDRDAYDADSADIAWSIPLYDIIHPNSLHYQGQGSQHCKYVVLDADAKLPYRVMSLLKWTITHIAPLFIVTSPITSYADQIWSMSKKRSSAGFSLDIPLIMLVASILK